MSKSEIKFIGTGSGKSSLNRYFSSFIISGQNYNLLIDAGDGISRAFLSQKISFSFIDGILLTHLHPDHYSGLASLIVQMKLTDRKNALQIFVHKNLKQAVEDFLYHSYIFKERMGFEIVIKTFQHNKLFRINNSFNFVGRQNSHLNKYKEYADERNLNFPCGSFLFEIENKKIFYTGDIGSNDDLYLFKDFKPDIIISEITHIDFAEISKAYESLKPDKIYLTHISDEDEHFLINAVRSQKNIILVVDGFTIQI